MPKGCAGFGFVCKAHAVAHIEIRAGACNAVEDPTDRQDIDAEIAGKRHLWMETSSKN
jgi:hypothetical protein